jgi:hypothetical protein
LEHYLTCHVFRGPADAHQRVVERRWGVGLKPYTRDADDLAVARIGERIGRLLATIKKYVDGSTGKTAMASRCVMSGIPRIRRVPRAA